MNETLITPITNSGNSLMITLPSFMGLCNANILAMDSDKNIYVMSYGTSNNIHYLLSFDKDGNFRWQNTLVVTQFSNSVLTTENRNYKSLVVSDNYLYLLGNYAYRTSGSYDADTVIMKFDLNGNVITNYRYADGEGWASGAGGIVTDNYVCCQTMKWNGSRALFGVMVFNKNDMSLKSSKSFSSMTGFYTSSYTSVNDNIYFSLGGNRIIGYNATNASVIFTKKYSNIYTSTGENDKHISIATDGTYLYGLGNTVNTNNYASSNLIFIKLDLNGNVITSKKLTSAWAYDYCFNSGIKYYNNFLYMNFTKYNDNDTGIHVLVKTDLEGNVIRINESPTRGSIFVGYDTILLGINGGGQLVFKLDINDFENFNSFKYGTNSINPYTESFNFEPITTTATNQTDGALSNLSNTRSTSYSVYYARACDKQVLAFV